MLVLKCDHEEADKRMMLHASNCSFQHPRLVVQSPDTNVAVLCLHTYESMRCGLWFKTGEKDKVRFILVHTLTKAAWNEYLQPPASVSCIDRMRHNKCTLSDW